eukprot:Opistho-2@56459
MSSDWTGDFCADTRPTPRSFSCSEPVPTACPSDPNEPCLDCMMGKQWVNAPYANVMGYASDTECTARGIDRHFTPQQHGRMRCYVDLYYQQWTHQANPAPVVFTPTAEVARDRSVNVTWFRSIRSGIASDLRYEVERTPAFSSSRNPVVADTQFVDVTAVPGVLYSYRVSSVTSAGRSQPSPPSKPVLLPPDAADDAQMWRKVFAEYRAELTKWETVNDGCNKGPLSV